MLQISWYFDDALNPVENISTWEFYKHSILNKDNMDSFYKSAFTVLVNNVNFYSLIQWPKQETLFFISPTCIS